MKIERLTAESRKNLLEDLLKRSPNQYGQYEERVQADPGPCKRRERPGIVCLYGTI